MKCRTLLTVQAGFGSHKEEQIYLLIHNGQDHGSSFPSAPLPCHQPPLPEWQLTLVGMRQSSKMATHQGQAGGRSAEKCTHQCYMLCMTHCSKCLEVFAPSLRYDGHASHHRRLPASITCVQATIAPVVAHWEVQRKSMQMIVAPCDRHDRQNAQAAKRGPEHKLHRLCTDGCAAEEGCCLPGGLCRSKTRQLSRHAAASAAAAINRAGGVTRLAGSGLPAGGVSGSDAAASCSCCRCCRCCPFSFLLCRLSVAAFARRAE